MAKETMQAVSEAEQKAHETVLRAKQESESLISQAREECEKLLRDAEKEAAKRVEILRGVARADGEKIKAGSARETQQEQEQLRAAAVAAFPQAAREIKSILLGQSSPEGR